MPGLLGHRPVAIADHEVVDAFRFVECPIRSCEIIVQPVELTTASPRQPIANSRLASAGELFDGGARTLPRCVVSVVFCLGAESALSERIAIWPPLAATAFGV